MQPREGSAASVEGAYGPPAKEYPSVWLRSIKAHTYVAARNGDGPAIAQPEGSYYLAFPDQVETICDVLKFAVRDTAPTRAVRKP